MKRDPLREFEEDNRRRREAGTIGPDVDDEIMRRALDNAKKVLATQAAEKAPRRRFRPRLAVLLVACLLMAVPMFAFGEKPAREHIDTIAMPGEYHFYLDENEYTLVNRQLDGSILSSFYTYSEFTFTLIEQHGEMEPYTPFHSNDPNGYGDSIPFYGVTLNYYVDSDGVSGYAELTAQKCLLRVLAPSCTEEQFLDIVSHIQMQ